MNEREYHGKMNRHDDRCDLVGHGASGAAMMNATKSPTPRSTTALQELRNEMLMTHQRTESALARILTVLERILGPEAEMVENAISSASGGGGTELGALFTINRETQLDLDRLHQQMLRLEQL